MKGRLVISMAAGVLLGFGASQTTGCFSNVCNSCVPSGSSPCGKQQVRKEVKAANRVMEIQEADFQNQVLNSKETPVLVDFFAPWCGPCRALAPALESMAGNYEGRLKVVRVNVDDARQLADEYGINSIPTLVFFRNGKAVDTIVGLPSDEVLRARLDAAANSPM